MKAAIVMLVFSTTNSPHVSACEIRLFTSTAALPLFANHFDIPRVNPTLVQTSKNNGTPAFASDEY